MSGWLIKKSLCSPTLKTKRNDQSATYAANAFT